MSDNYSGILEGQAAMLGAFELAGIPAGTGLTGAQKALSALLSVGDSGVVSVGNMAKIAL